MRVLLSHKMPKTCIKQACFMLFFLGFSFAQLYAQGKYAPYLESFEGERVLEYYHGEGSSELQISEQHSQFGQSALQWDWSRKGAYFESSNFSFLENNAEDLVYNALFPSSPAFIFSVYQEKPQQGEVKITFLKGGNEKMWFTINLDFYGWRSLRVPFYEMEGDIPEKTLPVNYDALQISSLVDAGRLYFDDMIFSQYQDDRFPYPDLTVPFIKADQDHSIDHWMPLISNLELLDRLDPIALTDSASQDIALIQSRINEELYPRDVQEGYDQVKEDFEQLGLYEKAGTVAGPPLTYNVEEVYYDSLQQGPRIHTNIHAFGKEIRKLAEAYILDSAREGNHAQEYKAMFVMASRYYLDQGWQKGSSGGTRHHVGYATRELTEAFYMMREPLREAGLLEEIGESLQWLTNLGMILEEEDQFNVNIDYLNTQSYNHLLQLFLTANPETTAALLHSFSRYLTVILAQQDKEWGFKADGTAWHHNGHYPAYAVGAFQQVPRLLYHLSGTQYRLGAEGHANFKKAFLSTAEYSHLYDWGFGNAGRHPFEGNTITKIHTGYQLMVKAGNPAGDRAIDEEVAEMYVYLWGEANDAFAEGLKEQGIKAASLPAYKSFPYGATAVQRYQDWAAIIKGYSKYVWSSEIYARSNRYGKYPANGTIELLNRGGEEGSGYVQEGWDWNRYPGATIIYKPLEELEPEEALLMFLSEETFAGASYLEGNGVFGMVLDESHGKNADGLVAENEIAFPGKLTAQKSIFSFGNKILCIGTGITSVDAVHPVQTNLFQTLLGPGHSLIRWEQGEKEPQFPLEGTTTSWIIDPYGSAYQVLDGGEIHFQKKTQNSYHNKYSVRSGEVNPSLKAKGVKETKGDFASAWLHHGHRPKSASYQYVIYPFLSQQQQEEWKDNISGERDFEVLQADTLAHIARDLTENSTAYVVFEADQWQGMGLLEGVSAPSLLMIKEHSPNRISLSAVNPDLNFPVNSKKKNGFDNYSRPSPLTIRLAGNWSLDEGGEVLSIAHREGQTLVELSCVDGLPTLLSLHKVP